MTRLPIEHYMDKAYQLELEVNRLKAALATHQACVRWVCSIVEFNDDGECPPKPIEIPPEYAAVIAEAVGSKT